MTEAVLNHDAVTQALYGQIIEGIAAINKANEVLLAEEEKGSGLREIDKALKENKHENESVSKAWEKAEKARESYKKSLEAARNLFRTEVLHEEATESAEENDVDKEAVKETRGLVMKSLDLIKVYGSANGNKEIVAWADTIAVPQVGRKGESVVGQKKPRAQVKVGDTVTESFGEAAKQVSLVLSKNGTKVSYTSGDLVSAWESAGSKPSFEFHGIPLTVIPKEKAGDKK